MDLVALAGAIAIAYLLGTIPFGLLIARLFGEPNLRGKGSGNIGATNVWRVVGPKAAILVYLCDVGKGALAVTIGRAMPQTRIEPETLIVLCTAAVVLGSIFPFYLKFKGGKGVSTALGAVMTLLPLEAVVCVLVFSVVVTWSRIISLGSIIAACSLCPIILVEVHYLNEPVPQLYLYMSILVGLVVLVSHRDNISRLLDGTENRFTPDSRTKQIG